MANLIISLTSYHFLILGSHKPPTLPYAWGKIQIPISSFLPFPRSPLSEQVTELPHGTVLSVGLGLCWVLSRTDSDGIGLPCQVQESRHEFPPNFSCNFCEAHALNQQPNENFFIVYFEMTYLQVA